MGATESIKDHGREAERDEKRAAGEGHSARFRVVMVVSALPAASAGGMRQASAEGGPAGPAASGIMLVQEDPCSRMGACGRS